MSSLLLLSGGFDSALCLYSEPDIALCVGFDYGQPHVIELDRAAVLAAERGVPFRRVALPAMPRVSDVVFAGRNAVLLSVAAGIAQAEGLHNVIIGCNKSDSDCFPDCSLGFIRGMNQALSSYGVSVYAPLLTRTKADVVRAVQAAGVKRDSTWSCYDPDDGKPCGSCHACLSVEAAHV